ncbi:MAG: OST-HTH/LOTUS domain-containing protein [Bacteroidales bacterium]|nr:OST-HTH/LOTUS domain-containing protein [Bacteroidales bacterium]
MDKQLIENSLIEAVKNCTKENGWANLAEVGAYLRNQGIKYGKLSKFVESYSHLVEYFVDKSIDPPIAYTRLVE